MPLWLTTGLLAIGSLLFLRGAPLWTGGLLLLAALSGPALRRYVPARRLRSLIAVGAALAGTAVALSLLAWSSATFLTLMLGLAGWLKLAERDGPRDRFVAALAGLVLVGLGLPALPALPALLVLGLALACLIALLHQDAPARPGRAGQRRWPLPTWPLSTLPALVLTVLLFVFIPRITGDLNMLAFALNLPFVIETEAEANRTPPPDSAEIEAFRKQQDDMRVLVADFSTASPPFDTFAPPVNELYWRGPVYWTYQDGRWSQRPGFDKRRTRLDSKLTGETLEAQMREVTGAAMYDITVFPHQTPYLYALDIPAFTPPSGYITRDWQLMNMNPVRELLSYRAMSYVQFRAGQTPDAETMALALQLPQGAEPRTRALGRQLAAEHGPDPAEIARAGRRHFETGYTHDPGAAPVTGPNPTDSFLFETRDGFGMQFATAYALMMRAAGIPARVVTGYHGGLHMFLIERVYVLEKDAHAWVELYLEDYGWVRMDVARAAMREAAADGVARAQPAPEPAAEPGPQDTGLQETGPQAVPENPTEANGTWLERLDARWQGQVLSAAGLAASAGMLLAVGAGVATGLLVLWAGAHRLRRMIAARRRPASARNIDAFCRRLARFGIVRRPEEGLRSYVARVLAHAPLAADEKARLSARMGRLCADHYGSGHPPLRVDK